MNIFLAKKKKKKDRTSEFTSISPSPRYNGDTLISMALYPRQNSTLGFDIQVSNSTFKFWIRHSSFEFNIQVLNSTFKFWIRHSSFKFDIQVLNSTFKFYIELHAWMIWPWVKQIRCTNIMQAHESIHVHLDIKMANCPFQEAYIRGVACIYARMHVRTI